jgi:flavin-dependent dehydrogenase
MNPIRDCLIIGAGLAGSALAAALAAQGWDVLLVERDHLPRHKVCGEFLSPEAQSSLRALGLYEPIAALHPAAIQQAHLVTATGRTLQTPLPGCAWGLSRYALDAALATAAHQQGAELWTGATVQRYELNGPIATVEVKTQSGTAQVQARTVIAACGRHTAPSLPPRTRARARQAHFVGVKAHYADLPTTGAVELYFFPGGYVGINQVEGGCSNVCGLLTYGVFAQAGRQVEAALAAAATWNPTLGRQLAGGRLLPETRVAVAPVDPYRPAAPWDEIACVGDAATMIPPLCGDGMAMALRSAELCAPLVHDFLVGKRSLAEWQAAYTKAWHREFDGRLRVGRSLQWLLDQPTLASGLILVGNLVPGLARSLVRATRGATPTGQGQ